MSILASQGAQRLQALSGVMFVDNELRKPVGTRTFEHVNPATGRPQVAMQLASVDDADAAMESSALAFESWKRTPPLVRRQLLNSIAARLRDNTDSLAILTALEIGTPLGFGRWAVADAANWFDYYAGWTDKITGDTIPVPQSDGMDFTLREPVGVVVKILTWNSPIGGISMAVPAALAAGCTVVLKPAEQAAFATVQFARLCAEAGLPRGVINVVVGDATVSEHLVRHPLTAKISFTGGPATARKLQAAAAEDLKPLVLELGGKSAHIVYADADLDAAAQFSTVITALSGQGCSLPTRLLVERRVQRELADRVRKRLAEVVVGDPFATGTMMGPVATRAALDRMLDTLSGAVSSKAAKCLLGGERLSGALAAGFYLAPTLLDDVRPDSRLAQDEIFGPILSIIPFDGDSEAIAIANGTRYGLAAYVHTRSLSRAMTAVRELKAGGVGVNGKMLPASYATPFGGLGLSGYGREGGREGIEEFTHIKNVALNF